MHHPTPGLPELNYVKPATFVEACRFLAEHPGQARPFLGGTDTFVRLRDGAWSADYLLDVKGLPGMDEIAYDQMQGLTVGAAVTMNRVIADRIVNTHYPLLASAARTVASYQLRNRATIAGNVCNASPAGDTIGACLAYRAVLHVHAVDGEYEIPLAEFFTGPGRTVLKPGDIVAALRFPRPPEGHAARYIKLGRNAVGDLAIVGVTALGFKDQTAESGYRFRLALASVAPVPLVPTEAEAILSEHKISSETVAAAAEAAQAAATPISDTRGSARYRSLMVRNLVNRAVNEVWQELRG